MPLSVSAETVKAGPATRKRTYDQITRSQSRSQTPSLPAKRRRTDTSIQYSPEPSREPSLRPTPPRFVGDGLDFRRPTASAMAQTIDQTTIDLTQDENTPPPDIQDQVENDEDDLDSLFYSEDSEDEPLQIAPLPYGRRQGQNPAEPITISDSDDDDVIIDGPPPQPPESPEVQWIGQRRLPSPHALNLPSLAEILRRPNSQPELGRATPPELRRADAQTFRDSLRNIPGAIFNLGRTMLGANMPPVMPATAVPFAGLGPLPWGHGTLMGQIPPELDPGLYDDLGDDDDEYAAMELNYNNVGFHLDGLEVIDPVADELAAQAAADVYKPPPKAREGFTRDIQEENDVLVCVACEDELATGEDDIKQQVWVAKSCGHVFCGSCASQRLTYRNGNDRTRKASKRAKVDQLKACKAPGCNSKLTGKTSMFQVYL